MISAIIVWCTKVAPVRHYDKRCMRKIKRLITDKCKRMMLKTDSKNTNDYLPVLIVPNSITAPNSSKVCKRVTYQKEPHSGLGNVQTQKPVTIGLSNRICLVWCLIKMQC